MNKYLIFWKKNVDINNVIKVIVLNYFWNGQLKGASRVQVFNPILIPFGPGGCPAWYVK